MFLFFLLVCVYGQEDAIHLKDIQTLTLHEGAMTTGRRSSPVPHLVCIGGTAAGSPNKPRTVQCYNKGYDGASYQWKCEADLKSDIRLGRISVTCEGYHRKGDQLVLRGSCGLEYTLEYTPTQTTRTTQQEVRRTSPPIQGNEADVLVAIIGIILLFSFFGIIYMIVQYGCPPITSGRRDRVRDYSPPRREHKASFASSVQKPLSPPTTPYNDGFNTPPVVIVQQPPSQSSYTDGFITGSIMASRPSSSVVWTPIPPPVTTTTTTTKTIQKEAKQPQATSIAYGGTQTRGGGSFTGFSGWSSSSSGGDTHTSSSYGGTNSR